MEPYKYAYYKPADTVASLINDLRSSIITYKALNPLGSTYITDALSTMLRLLGEESEEASWLIQARFRMDPVELYNEE